MDTLEEPWVSNNEKAVKDNTKEKEDTHLVSNILTVTFVKLLLILLKEYTSVQESKGHKALEVLT